MFTSCNPRDMVLLGAEGGQAGGCALQALTVIGKMVRKGKPARLPQSQLPYVFPPGSVAGWGGNCCHEI